MTTVEGSKTEVHEQQLARLQAEVQALRDQLRKAQRLAAVGTMTAMVAHEFNNILTPIINYAQMARKNPSFTDKAIARAADGGQRASNICKAILGLTREQPTEKDDVGLLDLVGQTLAAMARDPQKDGIELVLQIPSDLRLKTRSVELQQVVFNLTMNARAAVLAKSGPRRIELAGGRQDGWIVLSVSDTGVGIAPENLEKVFQPFFTTRSGSDGESQGHGLGLTICRDIVTSMGGTISVQSKVDEGTSFILRLPAQDEG